MKSTVVKPPKTKRAKWEYLDFVYDNTGTLEQRLGKKRLEQVLNEKGEEGWELMRISDTHGNYIRMIFKRQKR